MLRAHDGNREPIVDLDELRAHNWHQLAERETSILIDVMRPVGRTAMSLAIYCNGAHVLTLKSEDLGRLQEIHLQDQQRRRAREAHIENALTAIRRH